ncbi:S66 peptidase family protein [Rubrivirga sp. IMCC43871]|uniref:S66 peptidase family protein n=1 Tax=Rubrivirga sp. IMCC43871 TaxID=3391575 RepID=UPI00398FEE5F
MPRSRSRRDVLRALGLVAVGAPLAGCGTGLGPWSVGIGARPTPPVPGSPAPPVAALPTEAPEVMAAPRAGRIQRIADERPVIVPPRLPEGGVVGLVAPAGVLRGPDQLDESVAALEGLGFRVRVGNAVLSRNGFLAGTDAARARDFMAMVTNPEVDAVVGIRGGWGCARILPLLDYDAIAAHPKPIVGYSDITALLVAIYARTGLVTFHGPVGVSTWQGLTSESFVRTLVEGEPPSIGPETRSNRDRTQAVRPGVAEGPVVGGNLTVLSALAGTGFLPDFDDHIVFFEEVGEDAYRIDRMLVQLQLAGALRDPAGIAFGQCSSCGSGGSAWTAEETIRRHLAQYECPSVLGAPIGHVSPVYTLPIGLHARLDAEAGTLEYLREPVA